MDFIDWCSVVLNKLIKVDEELGKRYEFWWDNSVTSDDLAHALFGERWLPEQPASQSDTCYRAMYWAIWELADLGLVEMSVRGVEDHRKRGDQVDHTGRDLQGDATKSLCRLL